MMSVLVASAQPIASPKWAIALHGGAGGNLEKMGEEAKQLRRDSLACALKIGKRILANGGSALDAVEAVVRTLEDDAHFNAGRGSVLTESGNVELDASIMDGSTKSCGAVANVTNVKNPITLARRVMTETKHVLLAGKGAEDFAATQNLPLVEQAYFISGHCNPLPSAIREPTSDDTHYGTVGCVALDQKGNLAAGTSTGGTSKKMPGRVGDSPIIGAGTYASNDTCAVSGTGIGEEYMRHAVAYDLVAQVRYANRSLEAAATEIIENRLKPETGGLIALSNSGTIVMQHNTDGMACGAADSQGRFETFLKIEK